MFNWLSKTVAVKRKRPTNTLICSNAEDAVELDIKDRSSLVRRRTNILICSNGEDAGSRVELVSKESRSAIEGVASARAAALGLQGTCQQGLLGTARRDRSAAATGICLPLWILGSTCIQIMRLPP